MATHQDRAHNVYLGVALVTLAITPTWLFTAWQVEDDRATHDFWTWDRWPAFIPVVVAIAFLCALLFNWRLPGLRMDPPAAVVPDAEGPPVTAPLLPPAAPQSSDQPESYLTRLDGAVTVKRFPTGTGATGLVPATLSLAREWLREDFSLRPLTALEVGLTLTDAPSATWFFVFGQFLSIDVERLRRNRHDTELVTTIRSSNSGSAEIHRGGDGRLFLVGFLTREAWRDPLSAGEPLRVFIGEPHDENRTLGRVALDQIATLRWREFQDGELFEVTLLREQEPQG